MKFKFTYLLFVGLSIAYFLSAATQKSAGSPILCTGAPVAADPGDNPAFEQTCAQPTCHDDGGAPIVEINGGGVTNLLVDGLPPDEYALGQTYSIQLTVANASVARFGFELVALSLDETKDVGSWTIVDTVNTQQLYQPSMIDRHYITHTVLGTNEVSSGLGQWTMNWTAPTTNVGPICFYYAAVAADGDNFHFGDIVYISSACMDAPLTGVEELQSNTVKAFPNPFMDYISIEVNSHKAQKIDIRIIDINGRLLYSEQQKTIVGQQRFELPTTNLPLGIYLVEVRENGRLSFVEKLIKSK